MVDGKNFSKVDAKKIWATQTPDGSYTPFSWLLETIYSLSGALCYASVHGS